MDRANKRLKRELGEENYTILFQTSQTECQTIAYTYRNQVIHLEITDKHPFHIPRVVGAGNMWNHTRYAHLPLYIYTYLGMCGESTNPRKCIWCRMFDNWSPANQIPAMCDRFVRVDEFISNSVKMEFVFQNKRNLPVDLLPTIFSYLHGDLQLDA